MKNVSIMLITEPENKGRKTLWKVCVLAVLMFVSTDGAMADKPDKRYDFHITQEALHDALMALVRQADVQLLYPYNLAKKTTGVHPVVGQYTVMQALNIMLRDTDFSGGLTKRGTVTVSRITSKPEREKKMLMRQKKRNLFTTISALIFGVSSAVSAQALEVKDSSAGNLESFEEIIVTARKKSETLIEVPMNITAVGSLEIADRNLLEPEDLFRTIAGGASPQGELILRGLSGGNDSSPNTTTTFTDGVPGDFGNTLFDVERIEILRGPQGTLWGSNAIGGTVQIITKSPNLTEMEVFGSLQASTEKNRKNLSTRVAVGVNIPLITDKLALRIAGQAASSTKKTTNTYSGFTGYDRDQMIRVKLLWQATDDLSVEFGFIHDKTSAKGTDASDYSVQTGWGAANWYGVPGVSPEDNGYMTVTLAADPSGPYGYGAATYGWTSCPAGQLRSQCRATSNIAGNYNPDFAYWDLVEEGDIRKINVGTLHINYEDIAGIASMSYVGSFQKNSDPNQQHWSEFDFLDIIPSHIYGVDPSERITHELRFSSIDDGSALSWTFGGFYNKNRSLPRFLNQYIPTDDLSRALAAEVWGSDISTIFGENMFGDPAVIWRHSRLEGNFQKELALFGEANYIFDLGDGGELEVTGGLRYYRLSYASHSESVGHFGADDRNFDSPVEAGFRKKASLSWRPDENLSVYALYSEGYRPGGANGLLTPQCAADPAAEHYKLNYTSDQIKNYEIGAKGALFDRKFHFSAAVYNIEWTDVRIFIDIPVGCNYTGNAGKARSQGVEFESTTYLTDDLTMTLNASYTHSRYTEAVETLGVEAGEEMTQVPKYNFYGALQQAYSIFDKDAFVRVGIVGYGAYKTNFKAEPGDISDAYVEVDVSTTVNVNDGVRVSLHVDNLFNKRYAVYRLSGGFWPDKDYRTVVYGRERTITLRADFGF